MEQITRYVVIRHQLETNGEYDEMKKVDITQYANRVNGVESGQPTAQYYLDDLVTWGNYGFTYKTVVGTWEELNALFAKKPVIEQSEDFSVEEYNPVYAVKEYEGSIEDNAEKLGLEAADDDKYAMEILVARYKTVDGKDLMAAGVAQGKQIGQILSDLLEVVLEEPEKNTKDALLSYVKEHYL